MKRNLRWAVLLSLILAVALTGCSKKTDATAEMDAYLAEHSLPNERTYYDPAKGDEKHECGLHAPLTTNFSI